MIFGVGTDIVQVARLQRSLDRFGDRFAERILTADEMTGFRQYAKPANFLAKRFAVKEAAAKAMGLGFQNGLQLRQISVGHDELGKPMLQFSGFASEFVQRQAISATHVSISDELEYAVAFVILETP